MVMKQIQLFRPIFHVEECLAEMRECLEQGWTASGSKTIEFENLWCKYAQLPHAHFLNSATAGLHLAVKILKDIHRWSEGDEIITTPLTFVGTNHAIMYERLKPVFADIDESLNLDPESVSSKITTRTKAIMFVGIGGNAENLLEVAEIARRHNIAIILDAAHMSGTRIGGRHVGFGMNVSVFSFQSVKNLPTADSGMICFADAEPDRMARELSWFGINRDAYARSQTGGYTWAYDVNDVGFKYRGNSVIAALAKVGLNYLDQDNAYRRKVTEWYIRELGGNIKHVEHGDCESSRHLFQVLVENREAVSVKLNDAGIFPGVHYLLNTDFKPYRYAKGSCPRAEYLGQRALSLPMHIALVEDDVRYICRALIAAAGN